MKTPEQLRLEAGLSMEQLAERAGVSKGVARAIEAGRTQRLRAATVQRIGIAFVERFKEMGRTYALSEFVEMVTRYRDECGAKNEQVKP